MTAWVNNARMRSELESALAAIISYSNHSPQQTNTLGLSGWSNSGHSPWTYKLRSGEFECTLSLQELSSKAGNQDFVVVNQALKTELSLVSMQAGHLVYIHEGVRKQCRYQIINGLTFLALNSAYVTFQDCTHFASTTDEAPGSGQITASMDGAIIDVLAKAGDVVTKGQTLVILEAMKMEHPLKSDVDGTIESITVAKGDQVKLRQLLASVMPIESDE